MTLTKPKRSNREHQIQAACVKWFGYVHEPDGHVLFAIPNGGKRDKATAKLLKDEGVKEGVPDLFLSVQRCNYGGLYMETKTPTGYLSDGQRQMHSILRNAGYKVEVVRSFDEFEILVNDYLSQK